MGILATSGMNAVAHAVEALWVEGGNPLTSAVAEDAIRTLAPALRAVVRAPEEPVASERALRGAWLAGTAFAATGSGLHHTICHVLGGLGLPHAETHAVVLPYVTAFNAPAAPEAVDRLSRALDGVDAVAGLRALERDLGVPGTLAELGLSAEHVDLAAGWSRSERPPIRDPRAARSSGACSPPPGAATPAPDAVKLAGTGYRSGGIA